jgi:hypothetical protein
LGPFFEELTEKKDYTYFQQDIVAADITENSVHTESTYTRRT